MKDRLFISLVIVMILFMISLFFIYGYMGDRLNDKCKERFGQQWEGRQGYKSFSICVNKEGDVKYP